MADRRSEEHAHTARVVQQVVDPTSPVPTEGYTRVLHDVPAAVLLVDVGSGAVLHANPAARALTGGLALPVAAREWADAAGFSAPGGQPYAPGGSPLERAARGQPVFGEPVSVPDGASRRPLWVTGFPLPREEAMALVVLFDLDSSLPEARVRDRAVVAAGLSFTISDPAQEDNPLVYVNPAFERTTGYSADEALGHNCRFLQGPDTAPQAVQRIRDALHRKEHAVTTLLNYRKDGTAFWNEVSLPPVYDGHGALTHFVGIQSDVTARARRAGARPAPAG
ncbi:MAG: PAS domain-containing protein [Actinomycetota bacterium]|nr:PAS domain-containing protein [Actinomycetota bacterium]